MISFRLRALINWTKFRCGETSTQLVILEKISESKYYLHAFVCLPVSVLLRVVHLGVCPFLGPCRSFLVRCTRLELALCVMCLGTYVSVPLTWRLLLKHPPHGVLRQFLPGLSGPILDPLVTSVLMHISW